jgi:hypothetical protein
MIKPGRMRREGHVASMESKGMHREIWWEATRKETVGRSRCMWEGSNKMVKIKVKLSLYRSRRPLGLWEVEAPTFSDIRLTDGGKVISPTRRPLFTPRKIPGSHFC